MEEAFLPTLKTILDAPLTSPVCEIDAEDVGLFLVNLTREDFLQNQDSQGPNVHDSLAFSIANEVLSYPDSRKNKLYVKLLLSLQLSANDFVKLKELRKLNDQMIEVVLDRLVNKNLQKFGSILEAYLSKNPNPDDEDDPTEDNRENDSQEEGNSTKAKQKRQLFSQIHRTIVLSPTDQRSSQRRGSSDVIESASSPSLRSWISDDDGFQPPRPPPSQSRILGKERPAKARKVTNEDGEVTRIEDTDEEEEEEVVSGNLSRRKHAPPPKIRLNSSEEEEEKKVSEAPPESLVTSDSCQGSSNQHELSSLGVVTSTQKDSESSEESRLAESFFDRTPGKQPRKLRKKGSPSTSTDEDGEEEKRNDENAKRGKAMEKRKSGTARKVARRAQVEEEDKDTSASTSPMHKLAGKRTRRGRVESSTSSSSKPSSSGITASGKKKTETEASTPSRSSSRVSSSAGTPVMSSTRRSRNSKNTSSPNVDYLTPEPPRRTRSSQSSVKSTRSSQSSAKSTPAKKATTAKPTPAREKGTPAKKNTPARGRRVAASEKKNNRKELVVDDDDNTPSRLTRSASRSRIASKGRSASGKK